MNSNPDLAGQPTGKRLAVLALAALVTLWLARLFLRRLGGHTGDLLGAVQQAAELACYVGILGAAS